MEIRWHGHACFELSEGDTTVLVDPFLKPNNPSAVVTADEVEPTHIAITHGHVDHIADAVLGGTVRFDWGYIGLVPAWHTNTIPGSDDAPFSAEHGISIGVPAGLVIKIG